jgi:hypothetical protein
MLTFICLGALLFAAGDEAHQLPKFLESEAPMKEDENKIERSSMKILLPVDGSLCSLAAAREAAQRPGRKAAG